MYIYMHQRLYEVSIRFPSDNGGGARLLTYVCGAGEAQAAKGIFISPLSSSINMLSQKFELFILVSIICKFNFGRTLIAFISGALETLREHNHEVFYSIRSFMDAKRRYNKAYRQFTKQSCQNDHSFCVETVKRRKRKGMLGRLRRGEEVKPGTDKPILRFPMP